MQLTGFAEPPTALPAQSSSLQAPLLRPALITIAKRKSGEAWRSLWCPGPRLPLEKVLLLLRVAQCLLHPGQPLCQRLPQLKGTRHWQQARIGTQCIVQFLILSAITGDPQQWHLLLTQPPQQHLPAGQHKALHTDGQLLAACVQPLQEGLAHHLLTLQPAAGNCQGVCPALCCFALQGKGQVRLLLLAAEQSTPIRS